MLARGSAAGLPLNDTCDMLQEPEWDEAGVHPVITPACVSCCLFLSVSKLDDAAFPKGSLITLSVQDDQCN